MRIFSVILLVLGALSSVQCQQMTPFLGQGTPPPGGCTVYVSIALDRLIDINDENYRFECILFMLLTWSDPRAKPAMVAATEAQNINGTNCTMPCTSMFNYDSLSLCCDGMWLPHLEFMNARGFSQDRIVRYGIQFGDGENSSAVAWWAQVAGEYYTNLDFRAFPFDSQNLIIQIAYADRTPEIPVNFVQGDTAVTYFLPKAGDDISGWSVENITMSFYNITDKQIYSKFTQISKAGDPFPIHPANPYYPDPFRTVLWQQGFVIFIQIDRIYVYFILTAIVPIALNVWLALLVFSVSPKHLDTRLGIIVTLFLSLTALMLVVGDVLPQSSVIVPTQQLVLLSYLILGFVGLESIILYKIVTVERQNNIKQRTLHAKKTFLKRWDALSTNFRRTHTAGGGVAARSSKSGLGLRRRKTLNGSAAAETTPNVSGLPADIRVDVPDDFQQQHQQLPQSSPAAALATSPFNQANSLQEEGGQRRERMSRTQNESQQNLPFGGINVGIDSDDSQPFGGISNGSDFDSSDDNRTTSQDPKPNKLVNNRDGTTPAPAGKMSSVKAWFVLAGRRMKETNREIKRNPDYALYWALSVDKWVFWITLIAYNIALIVIFAINATYQAPVLF